MKSILLQMDSSLAIIGVIAIIIAGGLFFLAIRELVTWYWKIDTLIKNQATQIAIERAILKELQKRNEAIPTGSQIEL